MRGSAENETVLVLITAARGKAAPIVESVAAPNSGRCCELW